MERLALKMRANKVHDCGLEAAILVNELVKGELTQGYLVVEDTACWHVWSDEPYYDIGMTLAKLADPGFSNVPIQHALEADQFESDPEIIQRYELYKKDPKQFWKTAPKRFQDFRAKILRENNKSPIINKM